MLWFTRLARRHGFRALVIEHTSDRFTVNNPAKNALVTLPIVTGRSRNGQPIVRRQRILEPTAAEGQRLEEIITAKGEPLVAYHHRKLVEVLGADKPDILDLRDVVPIGAISPTCYYPKFFKMLTGRMVLFEDFVVDDQTAAFFQSTVAPAWRRAVRDTGHQPQIVQLTPGQRATSSIWSAYPAAAADDPAWIRRPRVLRNAVMAAA
jgi:hypothetical protein